MADKPEDNLDPSDWLASQFGSGDDEPKKSAAPTPPAAPIPDAPPPTLANPLAGLVPPANEPPPASQPQGAFDWGLGGTPAAQQPPTPAAPANPPPAEPAPADPALPGVPAGPEPLPGALPWENPAEPSTSLPWEAPTETTALPWETVPDPTAETTALPWETVQEPAAETTAIPPAEPTQVLGTRASARREGAASGDSGLDSLFGDTQFKEYEDASPLATIPFGANAAALAAASGEGGDGPKPPRRKGDPLPRNQKILMAVAGGLVAVLALVLLFVLGTKLPTILGPAPAVQATPSKSASPTPTILPVGPVAIGVHKWDQLLGGECLDPYVSQWEEKFTVVDCGAPHPAQMIYRGVFPPATAGLDPAQDPYPGIPALQAAINLLCTTPSVINLDAAGQYTDVLFTASYAATADQWTKGDHNYYCFVTRANNQPITGSVAVAPKAP